MSERHNMKSRWPVLLFVVAALILLLFGIWIELPGWLIAVMVLVPLSLAVFFLFLGRHRRDPGPADKYEISSAGAHSEGHLELNIPTVQLEPAFRATVATIPRLQLRACSAAGAEIDAALNWKTWGLIMSAEFQPANGNRTHISVITRPRLTATVTDWGQGRSDIHSLFEALERQVAIGQPQR
ncbi:hypothetical protein [Citricoccus zhacaiensis]|nr:hypothetical protein [Citricoccus zhacaiensis]